MYIIYIYILDTQPNTITRYCSSGGNSSMFQYFLAENSGGETRCVISVLLPVTGNTCLIFGVTHICTSLHYIIRYVHEYQ